MKRKRKTPRNAGAEKRQKLSNDGKELLLQYYPKVQTLRQYLASRLSRTSKNRRKRVLQYGRDSTNDTDWDASIREVLDSVVVGTSQHALQSTNEDDIEKDISIFTQQVSESMSSVGPTQGALKQNEVGKAEDLSHVLLRTFLLR